MRGGANVSRRDGSTSSCAVPKFQSLGKSNSLGKFQSLGWISIDLASAGRRIARVHAVWCVALEGWIRGCR